MILPSNFINGENVMKTTLYVNGHKFFYGYIFKIKPEKEGTVEILAYDQLRYFKNNQQCADLDGVFRLAVGFKRQDAQPDL